MSRPLKHPILHAIAKWVMLALTLGATGVLIFEACLPSKQSSIRSQAVGQTIGGLINDINGDQAKIIVPESCSINLKKTEFAIGESATIDVTTYPTNSTYVTYSYTSSNTNVATVDDAGFVNFLAKGQTTITVRNTKVKEVSATIKLTVNEIVVTSIKTSIVDAEIEDDCYMLITGKNYYFKNTFEPKNATNQNVVYTYDYTSKYIRIVNDTIEALEASGDEFVEITAKCQDVEDTIKVKTYTPIPPEEDIEITGIGVKASTITRYTNQTSAFSPTVTYTPSNTSKKYKGYTLESSDTSIVKINSNKTSMSITGTTGTVTITLKSTYNLELQTTFTVKVLNRPTLTSLSASVNTTKMYIENTQKIKTSVSPSGVEATITYSSNNEETVSVSSAGLLTANSVGTATITVTAKDKNYEGIQKTKNINIQVVEKPNNCATDFNVLYKIDEEVPALFIEQENDLSEFYAIESFIGAEEEPTNYNFAFEIDTDKYPGTFSGTKFTPKFIGQGYLNMVYTNEDGTKIYKEISFLAVDRFEVYYENEPLGDSLMLQVDDSREYSIRSVTSGSYDQKYNVVSSRDGVVHVINYQGGFTLQTLSLGDSIISVMPSMTYQDANGETIEKDFTRYARQFTVITTDVYTDTLGVILKNDGVLVDKNDEKGILIYMTEEFTFEPVTSESTTRSNIVVTTSSNKIAIENGRIVPKSIGQASVTFRETYSNISVTYNFRIRNKVIFAETGAFKITGQGTFDEASMSYTLTNGYHAIIAINFDAKSSIKKATYRISDESVATVAANGQITPLKVGKTTLNIVIKDQYEEYLNIDLTIIVIRMDFIQNWTEFTQTIRKLVGHFGAFAILGVLAVITSLLWFRDKLYPLGLLVTYLYGFGIAGLTEAIQTVTPGRAGLWTDVAIDYTGYSSTVSIFTLVVIIVFLIKWAIKTHKEKKK